MTDMTVLALHHMTSDEIDAFTSELAAVIWDARHDGAERDDRDAPLVADYRRLAVAVLARVAAEIHLVRDLHVFNRRQADKARAVAAASASSEVVIGQLRGRLERAMSLLQRDRKTVNAAALRAALTWTALPLAASGDSGGDQ